MSAATTLGTLAANLLKLSSIKLKKKYKPVIEETQEQTISNTCSIPFKTHNITHSTNILQHILKTNKMNSSAIQQDTTLVISNEVCLMIEDSISHESTSRLQLILSQIDKLKFEEKLLIYLKLPAYLISPNEISDPLKQPLNPLGNRYEIYQTVMWIKTHLEEDPEISLPKQDVYDEYNMFCSNNNMKPLSTADFGKVMKQVYPRVRPRRLGTRGNSRYCYAGMRKRLVLQPPSLSTKHDREMEDAEDFYTNEEMLGSSSVLIREWAESYFNVKFPTLCTLGKYLVDNLLVNNQSLAAACLMNSPQDIRESILSTDAKSCQTTVSGNILKLRNHEVQLHHKIRNDGQIYRGAYNFQYEKRFNNQTDESKYNIDEQLNRSKRIKDNLNQLPIKNSANTSMKLNKMDVLPTCRQKNIPRTNNQPCRIFSQSACDNLEENVHGDEQINVPNRLMTECENISCKKETSKKVGKRASSCVFSLCGGDEHSSNKLLKLVNKSNSVSNITDSVRRQKSQHSPTSVELQAIRTPVILAINSKVAKKNEH